MDYGKNAFLKTEDLSRRVDALERKGVAEYGISQYSSATRQRVAGKLTLTRRLNADAEGGVALVLRLRFASAAPGSLTVAVYAQNCAAANERYSLGAGEQDVFLMANASVGAGAASVRIELEGNTDLLGYDLMVFGRGLRGGEDEVTLSTAGGYACVHTAGCAYLYALDAPETGLETVLCDSGFLSGADDGVRLYFCDRGVAWRKAVGGRIEHVADDAVWAVGLDGGAALIRDGAACWLADGVVTRIPSGTERVVSLLAVHGSLTGGLILRTENDKLYYKERAPRRTAAELRLGRKI